jgi:hypothetical protein
MPGEKVGSQEYKELVMSLAETPRIVKRLVSDLEESTVREMPQEKGWSVLEHICHLRDIEKEGYVVRIKKMLSEDQPFLEDIDGDKLAIERGYINQNSDAALEAFITARAVNIEAIRDLSADHLSKSAASEGIGPLTLLDLLSRMREHDREHIKELMQLREQLSA